MAFKINKTILTDKGETNEAYVRFSKYEIDKIGEALFYIEIFLSDREVLEPVAGIFNSNACKNDQIGQAIRVSLKKTIMVDAPSKRTVETEIPAVLDEDGAIITPARKQYTEEDVVDRVEKAIPDMTPLTNGTIFEYAYEQLRQKLISLYGEDFIEVV
jgi:hypothetical protein